MQKARLRMETRAKQAKQAQLAYGELDLVQVRTGTEQAKQEQVMEVQQA
jgi:hypothetical protein